MKLTDYRAHSFCSFTEGDHLFDESKVLSLLCM